ncbi:hypothetical protein [Halobacillus yeomjeoni]|uniref:Uncharacterized protein n=1 Tax=Halobacillus yeomjeoni TaxID=311194 RepID=A0A931MTD0_9BACI|nr:hypothetical protein [Halobacillus yeomjeoni]MBH0228823.1 hypothetical protein [Halobacillus yeomjeoni]
METESLESGFGYQLQYPLNGSIKVLFTIKYQDDRIILIEYLPRGTFRKILLSEIPSLNDRARDFLLNMTAILNTELFDTNNKLLLELYANEKPSL